MTGTRVKPLPCELGCTLESGVKARHSRDNCPRQTVESQTVESIEPKKKQQNPSPPCQYGCLVSNGRVARHHPNKCPKRKEQAIRAMREDGTPTARVYDLLQGDLPQGDLPQGDLPSSNQPPSTSTGDDLNLRSTTSTSANDDQPSTISSTSHEHAQGRNTISQQVENPNSPAVLSPNLMDEDMREFLDHLNDHLHLPDLDNELSTPTASMPPAEKPGVEAEEENVEAISDKEDISDLDTARPKKKPRTTVKAESSRPVYQENDGARNNNFYVTKSRLVEKLEKLGITSRCHGVLYLRRYFSLMQD
jgi:hypothetical protein